MKDSLINLLQLEVKKLNISLSNEESNKLIDFIILLDKWNKTYNLTSITDKKDMVYKHIIDSIVVGKYLEGKNFIDVGTGPGLPGIPLSIINSDNNFYLLDSIQKRINFIRQSKREIKLGNIQAILSRCEDYSPSILFDGVISRAFSSLSDMLVLCEHFVSSEGYFYALKGAINTEEIKNIPKNFIIENIIKLEVPECLGQRHLVVIKKGD